MRTSPLGHTGLVACLVVAAASVRVFPALGESAAIGGITTTQHGTVRLPGVEIVVTGIAGNRLASGEWNVEDTTRPMMSLSGLRANSKA